MCKRFAINNDGEIAILGCDGILNEFNQNGLQKISVPVEIREPLFLIPLENDWLIFNVKGEGLSISTTVEVSLPKTSSS